MSNHTFKNWCILGNLISKILKDCEAAWEKEREKKRLKERELEHHTTLTSKQQPPRYSYSIVNASGIMTLPILALNSPLYTSLIPTLSKASETAADSDVEVTEASPKDNISLAIGATLKAD
ncbi:hypothetical protein H0H87_010951 [Tephrocybe sp. NHM501043]|nr:hypothetical protein H0H87_010951 [Tephrocybe sp. NHM501043]